MKQFAEDPQARKGMLAVLLEKILFKALGAPIAVVSVFAAPQQTEKPAWCKDLPRPEYASLERVTVSDPWFEVYRAAPNTLAIYEPHQSEETIACHPFSANQRTCTAEGISFLLPSNLPVVHSP